MKPHSKEHVAAASDLHNKYPKILNDFHQVLARHGVQDMAINSVEFLHAPSVESSAAGIAQRAVGLPQCVPGPGGTIVCSAVRGASAGGGDGG